MYSLSNILIQASVNRFETDVIAAWAAYGKSTPFFWMVMRRLRRLDYHLCRTKLWCATIRSNPKKRAYLYGNGSRRVDPDQYRPSAYRPICLPYFSEDTAVIERGMEMLKTLVPFYFTYVSVEILSGAVRGTGDSLLPMLITCFGVCFLRIIWVYTAVPIWDTMHTVIISYPITWAVTSVLFIFYYLTAAGCGGGLSEWFCTGNPAPDAKKRQHSGRISSVYFLFPFVNPAGYHGCAK